MTQSPVDADGRKRRRGRRREEDKIHRKSDGTEEKVEKLKTESKERV